MGADYDFSSNAAADLAVSPDGKLLATLDHWGNVVVRDLESMTVQKTYQVDSSPGGSPTKLHWLPCVEVGLIMQCYDEYQKWLAYFVDAQTSRNPELVGPLEHGEDIWGSRNGLAVRMSDRIVVYSYK